jgi:hypothetical protein
MHERFVVARFVARTELQVAVQVEPQVVVLPRDGDALVGRRAGVNDRLRAGGLLGPRENLFGCGEARGERGKYDETGISQERGARHIVPQRPQREEADEIIQFPVFSRGGSA